MTYSGIQERLSPAVVSEILSHHSVSCASFVLLTRFPFFKMTLLSMQVFGEGTDAVKRSLEGIFDDSVPDGKVKINTYSHTRASARARC